MTISCGVPCCATARPGAGAGSPGGYAPEGCRCGSEAAGAPGDGTELGRRLLASAPPETGEEAALAVLAAHGRWLGDRRFVVSCVRSFGGQAWVRWPVVRRFLVRTPCSDLDHQVLLLACDLAVADSDRRFRRSTVGPGPEEGMGHGPAPANGRGAGAARGAARGA